MTVELASVTVTVDGNARAIWDVLMDFGHPERLAPTIDSATLIGEGEGAVRIVKSSRGLEIHEKLVACDIGDYRFRYSILDSGDMPFAGVVSYHCTVLLSPLSDSRTEILWRSEGEVDGPIAPIRAFLESLYRNAINRIEAQLND